MDYRLQGTQVAPNEVQILIAGDETPYEYYEECPFGGCFNLVDSPFEGFGIDNIRALLLFW